MADDAQDLLDLPPGRLDQALTEARFHRPELCYRLLDRARDLAERQPTAAAWPAEVAVRLAGRISRRLLKRALAVWQSLDEAARGVEERELLARLYGDGWIQAAAGHRRHADALRRRGEFDEARREVGEALRIYARLHKSHLQGCAQADRARIHRAEGEYDRAVRDGLEAMRLLERDLDPELFDRTVYRLCSSIRRAEHLKPRVAARLREIRRRRYSRRQLPWVQLRWAEHVVFLRLGQNDRALDTLNGTPSRLLAGGDLRGGCLAAMDLIDLHLADEIRDDAVAAAEKLLAELGSLGAGPPLVEAVRRCAETLAAPGDVAGLTGETRAAILS